MTRDFLYCEETDTKIYANDVVAITIYPNVKWIAKNGWYKSGTAQKKGWYFISIADKTIVAADSININTIVKDVEQGTSEYRPTLQDVDTKNPDIDYIVIPNTNIRLYEGDVVKLSNKPRTKWVVHAGWYIYANNQNFGWYFECIKNGEILPVSAVDLQLCTLITVKSQGSEKYDGKVVNQTRPFTLADAEILNRTFITVDTLEQRDNLDPNKLVNGRLLRVNNVGGTSAYYAWNSDTQSWDNEDFGGSGIPQIEGTIESPIILSLLEPGLYRVIGVYKISPNTKTTVFTAIDHLTFVSEVSDEDIGLKIITESDITDYIVSEDEVAFIDKYATQEYLKDNYPTKDYVDTAIAVLESQISEIISEFGDKVLAIVNERLEEALDRVSDDYINNLFD